MPSACTPRVSIAVRASSRTARAAAIAGTRRRRAFAWTWASATDRNRFTIQGDYQDATENVGVFGDVGFKQYDCWAAGSKPVSTSDTRLQVYFDSTERDQPPSGVGFELDTYDIDFQQIAELPANGIASSGAWGVATTTTTSSTRATLRFVPTIARWS